MAGTDAARPQADAPSDGASDGVRGLELRFDSHPRCLPAVRRAVEAYSSAHGVDDRAVADLGLCVNEALANVIRHAYGNAPDRPIHVRVECHPGHVRVSVRDWGNGQNPADLPARPYDPLTPGGLGLVCMRKLMDRVAYERQADGMLLVLEKNIG